MKFGRQLEMEAIARFNGMYVDYKLLKKQLKTSSSQQQANPPLSLVLEECNHPAFVREVVPFTSKVTQILHFELEKVNRFAQSKRMEIRDKLHFAAAQVRQNTPPIAAVERSFQTAEEMGQEIVDLDLYARQNFTAMRKIIKKYDKMNNLSVSVWLLQRLKSEPFCNLHLDHLMVDLSDVYFLVGRARRRAAGEDTGGVWKPPDSFDRRTTKYWVREKDVLKLKSIVVRHLPVLIFGREAGEAPGVNEIPDHGDITSVYFDSEDYDMYRTRLRREEGATLIRIRWYGDHEGAKTPIFVERKTHHESWSNEDSVKERFEAKDKNVAGFISGRWSAHDMLEKQCNSGVRNRQQTDKLQKLQSEIQEEILRRGLTPSLRTLYKRAAFQLTSTNDVRISLDWDLMMLSERYLDDPNRTWCRSPTSLVDRSQLVQFPYAVLEIKLNNEAPPWVEELLASGIIIPVPKFSKFMHGTCELYHSRIEEAPHWFADYMKERYGGATPKIEDKSEPKPAAPKKPKEEKEKEKPAYAGGGGGGGEKKQSSSSSSSEIEMTVRAPAAAAKPPPPTPQEREESLGDSSSSCWPFGNKDFSQFHDEDERPASKAAAAGGGKGGGKGKAGAGKNFKIEPKTFFANERTLLQWLNMVVLLTLLSVSLLNFGTSAARVSACVMIPVSILFAFYALYVFLKRNKAIASKSDNRFDDVRGPIVLVSVLLSALLLTTIFSFTMGDQNKLQAAKAFPL